MQLQIQLINQEYVQDGIGQIINKESSRSIWADVISVSRNEFFSAGRNGFNPSFVIRTNIVNYNREKIAVIDGVRYSIYRTYKSEDSDDIELYVQESVGVTHGG